MVRKIPLLGDIPLLRALFRSTEKEKKTTELLVFVASTGGWNWPKHDQLNGPYRDRLRSLRDDI